MNELQRCDLLYLPDHRAYVDAAGEWASYSAVYGVMLAIESLLKEEFPADLSGSPINGNAQLVGSQDFKKPLGNMIGVYLHRIAIDPTIPGGFMRQLPGSRTRRYWFR